MTHAFAILAHHLFIIYLSALFVFVYRYFLGICQCRDDHWQYQSSTEDGGMFAMHSSRYSVCRLTLHRLGCCAARLHTLQYRVVVAKICCCTVTYSMIHCCIRCSRSMVQLCSNNTVIPYFTVLTKRRSGFERTTLLSANVWVSIRTAATATVQGSFMMLSVLLSVVLLFFIVFILLQIKARYGHSAWLQQTMRKNTLVNL